MNLRSSIVIATALAGVHSGTALAQDSVPLGIDPPAAIRVEAIGDTALVRLFNSVDVLARGAAGVPLLFVSVIGIWGPHAGLDGGALTTQVYIALNDDGIDMRLYRIGPLLDPNVECITTENDGAVIYINYGLAETRQRARVQASLRRLNIAEADNGRC
jgi:hypothetical protein